MLSYTYIIHIICSHLRLLQTEVESVRLSYAGMCVHMYVCIYIYIYVYVCMYVCIYYIYREREIY